MNGWDNEIWLAAFTMIGGGVTFVTKFLVKKFNQKDDDIKELRGKILILRNEKHSLEINAARMERHIVKKTTKSRGKNKG